jgi:hypothetical protein
MLIVLCVYPASTWIQMNFYPNPDGPVNHTGSDIPVEIAVVG